MKCSSFPRATGFIPSLLTLTLDHVVHTSKARVWAYRGAYTHTYTTETTARNGTEVVVGEFAIPSGECTAAFEFSKIPSRGPRGILDGPIKSRRTYTARCHEEATRRDYVLMREKKMKFLMKMSYRSIPAASSSKCHYSHPNISREKCIRDEKYLINSYLISIIYKYLINN